MERQRERPQLHFDSAELGIGGFGPEAKFLCNVGLGPALDVVVTYDFTCKPRVRTMDEYDDHSVEVVKDTEFRAALMSVDEGIGEALFGTWFEQNFAARVKCTEYAYLYTKFEFSMPASVGYSDRGGKVRYSDEFVIEGVGSFELDRPKGSKSRVRIFSNGGCECGGAIGNAGRSHL